MKEVECIGPLYKNKMGRYEIDKDNYFTCGDAIEILIYNDLSEKNEWVKTRIEHNGADYYAVGYDKLSLNGVIARKRN